MCFRYEEFHPYLFLQLQNKQYLIYDMFDKVRCTQLRIIIRIKLLSNWCQVKCTNKSPHERKKGVFCIIIIS